LNLHGVARFVANPEFDANKGGGLSTFTLAYTDPYNREHTSYFDFVAFGKTAELIVNNFEKGKQIYVEIARPKQDRWEGKDGQKRSKVNFILERFEFVGKKSE
jgi:single-strand DNA-binding protein